MKEFLHAGEYGIVRKHTIDPEHENPMIIDMGDRFVWKFNSTFTNEQIIDAINLANKAYQEGYSNGAKEKAMEIRKALNFD